MSLNRHKMDQDELEEDILLHSVAGHLQVLLSLLQSSSLAQQALSLAWRLETAVLLGSLLVLTLTLGRFDPQRRVFGWFTSCVSFLPLLMSTEGRCGEKEQEWSETGPLSSIYSMQGRRPNNEDRAVHRRVSCPGGAVHIFAVLDGHGGHFSADFAKKHLLKSLEERVRQLKLLTSSGSASERLKRYKDEFSPPPDSVLKWLKVPLTADGRRDSSEGSKEKEEAREGEETGEVGKAEGEVLKIPRGGLVLSSREKPLEELPGLATRVRETRKVPFKPKTPSRPSKKEKGGKQEEVRGLDITEYISPAGEILYPKLIKDEVLRCDADLLVAAKKADAIGGTTLILAVLDAGQLWVANVGDSRGVFGNRCGVAVPMSYDHKPCQLKEKKRIQEAGGFVAMNGVWRVQGVLATSRALGDYPLKDKKVLVADPDVLSFSVADHRMEFAVLASDGLWDTHTNEEAVALVRGELGDGMRGARRLAQDAHARGSLDNVTVLVIDLRAAAAAE